MKEYFKNFNGGQGLDHWSPSSSQNFTRFVLNYSLPQEIRRMFNIRYKAPFGNLVNNTTQRLTCEILYQGDKKITLKNKNYDEIFQQELDAIDKNTTPVDDKDKLAREMMISFAHPTIENMKKAVKEIFGNEKLVAERYVSSKDEDMVNDTGNEVLIYKTKKYGVPCERRFEVNASGTIIAFSSSGCF